MESIKQQTSRSRLLRALEPAAYARLADDLERVQLEDGNILISAGEPIENTYFPETAVTAFRDVLADGSRVEVGIVGYEGMAGWPAILGCDLSPHEVVVQGGGGTALAIRVDVLRDISEAYPAVMTVLLRYINVLMVQVARTAVCNLRDPVERRLSSWLLMCHDRLEGDEIDLTHKVIASMLGIRRASVTEGLNALEGRSVIRSRRGRIVIRDREELRNLAGDGYGHAEAHYCRTIGPFGK